MEMGNFEKRISALEECAAACRQDGDIHQHKAMRRFIENLPSSDIRRMLELLEKQKRGEALDEQENADIDRILGPLLREEQKAACA